MDHELELLNHVALASAGFSGSGFEPSPEGADDPLGAIGYEAADPSLQAPLWHETMHRLANTRDWR